MKAKEYIYYLVNNSVKYKCSNGVNGFEEEGVKFGKETADKGVIKSYSVDFQFNLNDASYIRNILLTKGFNSQIRLDIYSNDFIKGETIEYSAYMDLSTVTLYPNYLTVSTKQGGFITFLDNMMNVERTFSNNSGFKNIIYNGNKYTFDVDFYGRKTYNPAVSLLEEDSTLMILPMTLFENNNNLEDLRIIVNNLELDVKEDSKLVNENCFIQIPEQKYLQKINFNFNIDSFSVKYNSGVGSPVSFIPQTADIKFECKLKAYSNFKDEWLYNDDSALFTDTFTIYNRFITTSHTVGVDQYGVIVDMISGRCINRNENYYFSSDIINRISGSSSQNLKIILTLKIKYIQVNPPSSMPQTLSQYITNVGSDLTGLVVTTDVAAKCSFKDYQLVPNKLINAWKLSDLYMKFFEVSRSTYNVTFNIDAIKPFNYYLTSASELCGDTAITTTFEKLLQFIYLVTGYRHIVNEIDGNYYCYFEKYENGFKNDEIAQIDNLSEVIIETEPDKIFTDIEVGWANEDSGIFKTYEYNTINKFRTGYSNFESNVFSLLSDYSASITDLETIAYNSGFNDKKNDKDKIFVIECYPAQEDGYLRNVQYANTGVMTLCGNVAFTPKRLLMLHKYELSDLLYFENKINFSSSNGLADIQLNGIRENDPVTFTDQIMQPFILTFDGVLFQSVKKIDANKYGYFRFLYKGNYIQGYLSEGTESVSVANNDNLSKFRLIVKKDVIL